MKKLVTVVFFITFIFFSFTHKVFADELIPEFESDITIYKDGTVDVIEYIQYDFGTAYRHGIYREIPYIKSNKDGKKYKLTIDVANVVDENAVPYKYSKTTDFSNGIITLKIGDPDKTITGLHSYLIKYRVYGALTYFSDHDELYWNAVGNGWTVPIEKALVTVALPKILSEEDIQRACFTGNLGSTEKDCRSQVTENEIHYRVNNILYPGEGLTVATGFPKGLVQVLEPKPYIPFQQTWYGKLIIGSVIITFLLLAFFWYVFYPFRIIYKWYRYGRDPKADQGEIRAWYDPPKTSSGRFLTPGETGTLVDEVVQMRDISATVVDLARRGYLIIEEKKKNDFYLNRSKKPQGNELLAHEKTLLSGIFKDKDSLRLKDAKLYQTIEDTKKNLYESLVSDGFFPKNPTTTRGYYIVIGILALFTFNLPLALVSFTFGYAMPVKTKEGAQAAAVSRSLKNFLSSQERQLKFQAKKQLMFERLLPFAVAFGVEKIWAERFKNLNLKPPEWFSSYESGRFSAVHFTNSLNSSFKSFSYAATPTSSSSGFSSGFSGGSSGGGGGGGGGGSW